MGLWAWDGFGAGGESLGSAVGLSIIRACKKELVGCWAAWAAWAWD